MANWYREVSNKLKTIMEGEIIPYDDSAAKHGELIGAQKENMTSEQAEHYIQMYPNGILKHDILEENSFVALTKFNVWVFWNSTDEKLEHWNWKIDLEKLDEYGRDDGYDVYNGWVYWSTEHFYDNEEDREWWDNIRNGNTVPE